MLGNVLGESELLSHLEGIESVELRAPFIYDVDRYLILSPQVQIHLFEEGEFGGILLYASSQALCDHHVLTVAVFTLPMAGWLFRNRLR